MFEHISIEWMVTDIYATSFDYDKDAKKTRNFFRMVQNKLHYTVHRHTAAELIYTKSLDSLKYTAVDLTVLPHT